MATKLSLVKTCREWNELATHMLYEHISVVTDQQYSRVQEMLLREDRTGPKKNIVSRLDIVRPDVQSACLRAVIDLCQLLPNLKTLVASVAITNDDDPSTLLHTLPPRLEHMYSMHHKAGDYGEQCIPITTLIQFLHSHPNLAALSIPFDFQPSTFPGTQLRNELRWPSIQALVLQRVGQAKQLVDHIPLGAFPNLRSINVSGFGSHISEDLHDYPKKPSLLHQLATPTSPTEVHLYAKEIDPEKWFGRTPAKFPQVTTLGLHWVAIQPSGIRLCQEIATMHRVASFPWTKVLPNLRTIRLMVGNVDIAFYRAHDHVTVDSLASPGRYARNSIRVEDIGGLLLGEISSGVSSLVGGPTNPVPHCDVAPRPPLW